jgi:peptidoglycan/xylan/chitin deacetylase (PgdA/CDA1 family)
MIFSLVIILFVDLLIEIPISVNAYEGGNSSIDNSIINISNLTESSIHRKCITPGKIALTYDDGPNLFTKEFITSISKEYRVTFFMNGWNYENTQMAPWHQIIKLAYERGHEIGNHGWNHWSYNNASIMNEDKVKRNLNHSEILEQMTKFNDLLFAIIGKAPTIFRPPYGQFDEDTLRIASLAGLKHMGLWNIDSEDWDTFFTPDVFKKIINTVMAPGISSHNSSFVIVMHEQIENSMLLTTPMLYTVLTKLGYTFVTMSECIGVEPYQTNYTPTQNMTLYSDGYSITRKDKYQYRLLFLMMLLVVTLTTFIY